MAAVWTERKKQVNIRARKVGRTRMSFLLIRSLQAAWAHQTSLPTGGPRTCARITRLYTSLCSHMNAASSVVLFKPGHLLFLSLGQGAGGVVFLH